MTVSTDSFIAGPNGRVSIRTKGLEARPQGVVLLVHASNITGQLAFDFAFPGGRDYSTMDALVAAGYGAVTFSLSGYGLSDPPPAPLAYDTEAAIADLAVVTAWLAEQGWPRVHLLGWSWGGRIAGHYAARHPQGIERLILMDPALGGNAPVLPGPADGEDWWANRTVDYLKRLEPEYTDPEGHQAFAEAVERESPRAPKRHPSRKCAWRHRGGGNRPSLRCRFCCSTATRPRGRPICAANIPGRISSSCCRPRTRGSSSCRAAATTGHLQGTRRLFHRAMIEFLDLARG